MINRFGVLALGFSVVAHLLLLSGAELGLSPTVEAKLPESFMQAQLIVQPLVQVPQQERAVTAPIAEAKSGSKPRPPPKPRPRPAPKPKPVPVREAAAIATESVQVVMAAPLENGLPGLPLSEARVAEDVLAPVLQLDPMAGAAFDIADADGWPRAGSIVYRVLMGDKGFEVGQASHTWSHDTQHYDMRVELKTTGVAALMRSFHYTQHSEGELGERGLRPLRFSVEQRGRASDEVEFDWAAGQAIIRRGKREPRDVRILPGDQDVLSLWHQVGIVGVRGLPTTLTVLTNKSAKPVLLEVVGAEGLRLPIGRLDTLRLRAQADDGSLTIDIWLATRYGMLPVRIRIADDEGEVLDQQAIQLRLTPAAKDGAKVAGEGGEVMIAEQIELKEDIEPLADLYRN